MAAPFGSPAVLHLRRYYGLIRPLAYPCLPPPVSLGSRFSSSRVRSLPMSDPLISRDLVLFGLGRTAPSSGGVESSPGFTGNPVESMPRARDSGDPKQPRIAGHLGAAFRCANGVGVAMMKVFGAESSRPASLLSTLRPPVTRPGARLATGLPAAALTGPDLHRLDSFEGFHRLITDPPFPRFPSAIARISHATLCIGAAIRSPCQA